MPRDMEVRPVHIPAPSQACHFPAKLKVSFRLGALTTPLTPLFNVGAATGGGQPSIIPLARVRLNIEEGGNRGGCEKRCAQNLL